MKYLPHMVLSLNRILFDFTCFQTSQKWNHVVSFNCFFLSPFCFWDSPILMCEGMIYLCLNCVLLYSMTIAHYLFILQLTFLFGVNTTNDLIRCLVFLSTLICLGVWRVESSRPYFPDSFAVITLGEFLFQILLLHYRIT